MECLHAGFEAAAKAPAFPGFVYPLGAGHRTRGGWP